MVPYAHGQWLAAHLPAPAPTSSPARVTSLSRLAPSAPSSMNCWRSARSVADLPHPAMGDHGTERRCGGLGTATPRSWRPVGGIGSAREQSAASIAASTQPDIEARASQARANLTARARSSTVRVRSISDSMVMTIVDVGAQNGPDTADGMRTGVSQQRLGGLTAILAGAGHARGDQAGDQGRGERGPAPAGHAVEGALLADVRRLLADGDAGQKGPRSPSLPAAATSTTPLCSRRRRRKTSNASGGSPKRVRVPADRQITSGLRSSAA